jgi:hypothetical protein
MMQTLEELYPCRLPWDGLGWWPFPGVWGIDSLPIKSTSA